jgi:hypothetical protein
MSISASAGSASASVKTVVVPLTASFLGLGSTNHKLELGAGLALSSYSGQGSFGLTEEVAAGGFFPVGTAIAGYRYVPGDGGFNFRIAFTPLFHPDLGFFPWAGLAFGYGF